MAWLVVGFGCDLAGDDGFGPMVAGVVASHIKEKVNSDAVVLAQRILAPELVEQIRLADGVIFVDASATLPPGVLQCTDLQVLNGNEQGHNSAVLASHHCDPFILMQLADTLYDSRPPAWLYAVGATNFDLSENLNAALTKLVPEVARQILERIEF